MIQDASPVVGLASVVLAGVVAACVSDRDTPEPSPEQSWSILTARGYDWTAPRGGRERDIMRAKLHPLGYMPNNRRTQAAFVREDQRIEVAAPRKGWNRAARRFRASLHRRGGGQ